MSEVAKFFNSKEFDKLVEKGRDQRYLTPEDVNDALPVSLVDPAGVDEILLKLKSIQIEIQNHVEEEDDEGIRLDGTEIIEETLSKEEKAELRSASTDPVKLYLKRMGSVALLTREGEVVIAKEIED